VRRIAVKLVGYGPYHMAADLLDECCGVYLATSHIWDLVQDAGAAACALKAKQAQQACALPDVDDITPGVAKQALQLTAMADGVMLNIRKQGWKEAKMGCVGEVVPVKAHADSDGEPEEFVRTQKIDYVFHLGGPEPIGEHLWSLAQKRDWLAAQNTSMVGDAAPWVKNLAERHFPYATHIVDWYHAKQHLWAAAHARFGPTDPRGAQWVDMLKVRLFDGDTASVAKAIADVAALISDSERQSVLLRESTYFSNNHSRMQFRIFRDAGLPIGSGAIESGAKQFKARFSLSGMRWNPSGAAHLFPFRAALMSNNFDALWKEVCP
jgi:hypothetical protein